MARPTVGHLDPAFLRMMDETRDMLRAAFRTKNELTFPVSGTGSAGMEACLANLIEPGDEALVLVNGVFGTRMADIVGRLGGKLHRLDAAWGEGFDPAQIDAALQGKSVKLVAFVHAETSTGYRQDVPGIAEVAHRHGALVVLDTVTSLGGIPVEIDAWGVDAVYSGTQKCLGCPPGLSPISFGPRAVEALEKRKSKVASWYLDLTMVRKYWGAERVYHHTAPINALYGLHESLRIVLEEGLEARWRRHTEAHASLAKGCGSLGLGFLVQPPHRLPQLNAVTLPPGVDDKAGRKALLEAHGIEVGSGLGALAGKIWRIGLMGEAARPEVVERALAALRQVLPSAAK
jgi:alanine-glyoxylate transaminase/serine-glyoxylate transaminase/serine-pyruvate transaminase